MQITRVSFYSRKKHTMEIPVTHEQLAAWQDGMLIQDAMPNISTEHREFIMSGITPEAEHINTRCLGYGRYDPGDHDNFLKISITR